MIKKGTIIPSPSVGSHQVAVSRISSKQLNDTVKIMFLRGDRCTWPTGHCDIYTWPTGHRTQQKHILVAIAAAVASYLDKAIWIFHVGLKKSNKSNNNNTPVLPPPPQTTLTHT